LISTALAASISLRSAISAVTLRALPSPQQADLDFVADAQHTDGVAQLGPRLSSRCR